MYPVDKFGLPLSVRIKLRDSIRRWQTEHGKMMVDGGSIVVDPPERHWTLDELDLPDDLKAKLKDTLAVGFWRHEPDPPRPWELPAASATKEIANGE